MKGMTGMTGMTGTTGMTAKAIISVRAMASLDGVQMQDPESSLKMSRTRVLSSL